MTIKEVIEQRVRDLKGAGKEKQGALIEATAAHMLYTDMIQAAEIARALAISAAVDKPVEPDIDDIMSINQLYQAYLNPAYSVLIARGDIPQPPVPTTPSSVKTKEDLVS